MLQIVLQQKNEKKISSWAKKQLIFFWHALVDLESESCNAGTYCFAKNVHTWFKQNRFHKATTLHCPKPYCSNGRWVYKWLSKKPAQNFDTMFCLSRQKRFAKGCKGHLGFDLLKQKLKVSKSYPDELDFLWSNTINRNKVASEKCWFFLGGFKCAKFQNGRIGRWVPFFKSQACQHQNNKKRETGRMKGKKKQGNKKENHICQTVAKNRKANASRTFSLVHLIHLHTFHFTCAPQLHLRISILTHLRTPFKTSCQYLCMSDRNLTPAPQQNFITCAHHWNRVFFNASFPSTSKNHWATYIATLGAAGGCGEGAGSGVRGWREISTLSVTLVFCRCSF